jgi:NAD(P)-dependent dehydrogenase (short-subunit alcohol dehydrogenase family)
MKERGYGRFVHTASAAGLFGNFGQANYAAAKTGLIGLSNVLAIEGARCGVTSNVIAPMAKTRLTEALLGPLADAFTPDLVSPLVAFLVAEECSLTHEIFSVGGGRIARVFLGLTSGWTAASGEPLTAELVCDHLDEIRDLEGATIPLSATDEMMQLMPLLQG